MRKTICLAPALIALIFASCVGKESIASAERTAPAGPVVPFTDGTAQWLSRDFSFGNTSGDSCENVNDFVSHGGVLAVTLRRGGSGSAEYVPYLIDMKTGEKQCFCPDPDCRHTEDSGCGYTEMHSILTYGDGVYYGTIIRESMTVVEAVPGEDGPKEIYRPANENGEFHFVFVDAVTDNSVFIREEFKTEALSNGQNKKDEYFKYLRYDRGSGDIELMAEGVLIETEWNRLCPMTDRGEGTVTDYSGKITGELIRRTYSDYGCVESETVFISPEGLSWQGDIYQDTLTDDIYICVRTEGKDSAEGFEGYIYRISPDGESVRLELPSDKIHSFYLTDKYIYYAVFDPTVNGADGRGLCITPWHEIYRADRNDLSLSELVFDTRNELWTPKWYVFGDCLYFEFYRLDKSGTDAGYRNSNLYAAVNFTQNSLKWYDVD